MFRGYSFSVAICSLVLYHLVSGQTATSWPPSTSTPASVSGLLLSCSGTASPPNGYGTIPQYLFSGIQSDLNDQNSEISQMIQATCNAGYASAHANYGSCNNGVCQFKMSKAEYNASYTVNKANGTPNFCLGAPVRDQQEHPSPARKLN